LALPWSSVEANRTACRRRPHRRKPRHKTAVFFRGVFAVREAGAGEGAAGPDAPSFGVCDEAGHTAWIVCQPENQHVLAAGEEIADGGADREKLFIALAQRQMALAPSALLDADIRKLSAVGARRQGDREGCRACRGYVIVGKGVSHRRPKPRSKGRGVGGGECDSAGRRRAAAAECDDAARVVARDGGACATGADRGRGAAGIRDVPVHVQRRPRRRRADADAAGGRCYRTRHACRKKNVADIEEVTCVAGGASTPMPPIMMLLSPVARVLAGAIANHDIFCAVVLVQRELTPVAMFQPPVVAAPSD